MPDLVKTYGAYTVGSEQAKRQGNEVTVRWLGVTGLLFDDGRTRLLFDPMVTRPGLARVMLGRLGPDEELILRIAGAYCPEGADAIFVSHTHYDHVLDTPSFARVTGAAVYGSASALNVGRGNGVDEGRLHCAEVGKPVRIGDFTVEALPSRHSKPGFYNDDLGVEIARPLPLPAPKRALTEGGSVDYLVTHGAHRCLIRPSCGIVPGALEGVKADVVFLGVGQLGKLSAEELDVFWRETVARLSPRAVVPIHWDNFFVPLRRAGEAMPVPFDRVRHALEELLPRLKEAGSAFALLPAMHAVSLDALEALCQENGR